MHLYGHRFAMYDLYIQNSCAASLYAPKALPYMRTDNLPTNSLCRLLIRAKGASYMWTDDLPRF